ncbi:DUF4034 domain-containing protein [Massilia pseudoviolaceinigra]|uniref:DUF4034 domain-containing protein n=1 Tax=Massilia pseudoviolaceinigra TaxID=3057165 RepID=UPI002796D007|nr:DUF4034 domain-containing protein [Massilia sp. CCM 9206]MDQ1920352.1 DUF4034 domain-containing protein [Massilia sp. CCM 9206]
MKLNWQSSTTVSALLLALISSINTASACTKNNHIRPAEIVSDEVHKLMKEKNYKKLDELYTKYSKKMAKTPDGVSALSPFFSGIAQTFNVACTNPKRSDEEWLAHQASLSAWLESSPTSMGAKLALAFFAADYAWYARGSGYSSTVSDASQKIFEQRMASAKRQLDKLAGPGKNNPAWYEGMLTVGLAQGWAPAKFDAMYNKAAKVDPYYLDIHYTNIAFHDAKWYGSDQEVLSAINRAAQLTKARLGDTMYTRLHWTIAQSPDMFETGGANWTRMKAGFEDYLRLYSDTRTRNNYALYACMAEDKPTLREQLALLGNDLDPKKWSNDYQYAYCTAYAKLSGLDQKPACFTRADTGAYFCK